jgi:hypothetical protein
MSDFFKKNVYDEAAMWYFFCFAIAVRPILQYVSAPLTGSCLSGRPLNPTPLAVLIQKKVITISLYYVNYELSFTCFSV